MREDRGYRRIRRLLSRVLPAPFDRRWGDDIARTSVERSRDARAGGPIAWAGFLLRETFSLLMLVIRARTHPTNVPRPVRSSMMFEPEDNRPYRVAWVVALLVHFGAFVVVVPFDGPRIEAAAQEELTVIRVYEPPPPPDPETTPTRKRRASPVPIPDATPDELEPIVSETERDWVEPAEAPEVTYQLAPPAGGPPVAAEPQVYRPGPHVQRPELIERIEPEYPEIARRARLACTVILEAHIGRGGEVLGVEILRPCGLGLDQAAVEAVSRWRYAPTLVDGRPVEVALTVTVVFKLE